MRLYAGPSTHFIQDTTHNQIAEKLRTAFVDHAGPATDFSTPKIGQPLRTTFVDRWHHTRWDLGAMYPMS